MLKYYSRFKRGDVWFLYMPLEESSTGTSVIKKSRPYLIVSCEENNNCAPTLNVVPITTRDSDHLPPHVYFRYDIGTPDSRNQLVLCEQITTVGMDVFNHPKSYFMYSFSLEFMNKVDEALAAQLGLRVRVADMNILDALIDKLVKQKEADIKKLQEDALNVRVEDLAARLAKKFGLEMSTAEMLNGLVYNNPDLEYAPAELREELETTARERTTRPAVATKVSKNVWTQETKTAFVNDYKTLGVEACMDKYSLTKKSAQQMYWKFRKIV